MDTVDVVLAWTLAAVAVVLLAHGLPTLFGRNGLRLPGRLDRPIDPHRPRSSAAAVVLLSVGLILLGLYVTAAWERAILVMPGGAACFMAGMYWFGQLRKRSRRVLPLPRWDQRRPAIPPTEWPYQS